MIVLKTSSGDSLSSKYLAPNYFASLINRFFKILPMKENNEESLNTYIKSFQSELFGCKGFIPEFQENDSFLRLLSILQFFIDNPDATVSEVRREVFAAISLCNKLKDEYTDDE